jgi:hypothetical protein
MQAVKIYMLENIHGTGTFEIIGQEATGNILQVT